MRPEEGDPRDHPSDGAAIPLLVGIVAVIWIVAKFSALVGWL